MRVHASSMGYDQLRQDALPYMGRHALTLEHIDILHYNVHTYIHVPLKLGLL